MLKCLHCQATPIYRYHHCRACCDQDLEAAKTRREQWYQEQERNNMVNVQDWLNQKFPTPESKQSARAIDAADRNLTGELKLIGFSNLERADFWKNQLTKLDISQCPRLTYFNVGENPTLQERPLFFLAEWKKKIEQEIQLIKEVLHD